MMEITDNSIFFYGLLFLSFFLIESVYFKLADRYNIIDKPNARSSHSAVTIRGGGIIFPISVLYFFISSGFNYPYFVIGLMAIAAISFLDDIKPQSPRTRLWVHFISIALLLFQLGLFEGGYFWYVPLALIVCTGILNCYNFMDGINGITGGYSLVVLLSLFYINNYIVAFSSNLLMICVIASILVFLFYNFRIKARCFAGDVGAISIAFIIIFLMGQLIVKTNDLSYLFLLVVYGIDASLTIVHRVLLKEKLTEAHRKHLYQILANELKWKHISVSLLYMALQGVCSFVFIQGYSYRWCVFVIGVVILSMAYVCFIKKYFHLHKR